MTPLNPMSWLYMHHHGWKYGKTFLNLVFKKVQILAFKSFGTHWGPTQIDYLTENLHMDPNHKLQNVFCLVHAHSKAQPYYLTKVADAKKNTPDVVGKGFTDDHRMQIVFNEGYNLYKDELMNLKFACIDAFEDYDHLQEKFLLAEQHKKQKSVTMPSKGGKKNSNKREKIDNPKGTAKPSIPICSFCNKHGHVAKDCQSNPKGDNYKPRSNNRSTRNPIKYTKKATNTKSKLSFQQFLQQKKASNQHCLKISYNSSESSIK